MGNVFGGLSDRPSNRYLRMIYQVYLSCPAILGGGGIISTEDALIFMVGAKAVSVGTGLFVNPLLPLEIVEGIKGYLLEEGLNNLDELVGAAHQV